MPIIGPICSLLVRFYVFQFTPTKTADPDVDCLTASVFSKSTEQVIAGKDGGTVAAIKTSWEYAHWATRFPLFHKVNLRCRNTFGYDLWGRTEEDSPPIYEVRSLLLFPIQNARLTYNSGQ
jgi:hypothetical protein